MAARHRPHRDRLRVQRRRDRLERRFTVHYPDDLYRCADAAGRQHDLGLRQQRRIRRRRHQDHRDGEPADRRAGRRERRPGDRRRGHQQLAHQHLGARELARHRRRLQRHPDRRRRVRHRPRRRDGERANFTERRRPRSGTSSTTRWTSSTTPPLADSLPYIRNVVHQQQFKYRKINQRNVSRAIQPAVGRQPGRPAAVALLRRRDVLRHEDQPADGQRRVVLARR